MPTVKRVQLAYNNVYIVADASAVVVIDTGPDYRGAREALTAALGGATPDLVVATHGHLDHAGLGGWWQRQNVAVALGAADLPLARGSDFDFEAMAAFVRRAGAPAPAQAEALDGLRIRAGWNSRMRKDHAWTETPAGRWPTNLHYEPFDPARTLNGAVSLPCGLEARPAPGHTPGNLVVHHESEGWLFSGDQLLPEITPTPAIQFEHDGERAVRFPSLPRFVDSLAGLRSLRVERCFPGHGEPFANATDVLAANLAQAEQRTERLAEALREGPGTLYQLAERLYPRALRRRFWQIIATVQGHLDLLAEAGQADCRDGVWQ